MRYTVIYCKELWEHLNVFSILAPGESSGCLPDQISRLELIHKKLYFQIKYVNQNKQICHLLMAKWSPGLWGWILRKWCVCYEDILLNSLTLNCIRGGFHGTQHLVFRLSHFNAAIFRADNFCNCLNSSCASFGEKKIEVRHVVFALISII